MTFTLIVPLDGLVFLIFEMTSKLMPTHAPTQAVQTDEQLIAALLMNPELITT